MTKKQPAAKAKRVRSWSVPMPAPYIGAAGQPLAHCKQWSDGSRSVVVKAIILSGGAANFASWMLASAAWVADAPKKGAR